MADDEKGSSNNPETKEGTEENKEIEPENYIFVAALDFGTSYSGYAFSSRADFAVNPLLIHTNQEWIAGGTTLTSMKTPTSILIKKDGSFLAFGFEAEDRFYSAMTNEQREEVMLFRRFKMKLHNKMGINKDLFIEDVTGKRYPAHKIFTLSIKAMVGHFREFLKKTNLSEIGLDDIKWVLTVPAIWSDAAKKFMRQCATDAGIPDSMLQLALEPEAASIYAQYVPVEKNGNNLETTKEGTKYMIVDIGGGTADITVHEKIKGGKLRELHQATGGACGGTAVDAAFESCLTKILGDTVMKTFRESNPESLLDIFRDFEIAKRKLTPSIADPIRMAIPAGDLDELCQNMKNKTFKELLKKEDGMSIKGNKLYIEVETMKQFFKPSIRELIQHIKGVMQSARGDGISMILLVGGSAESEYIQNEIRKEFSSVKLVVPSEAGLAVLKGAVIFGHCPTMIMSRILRFTYGTNVSPEFDPKIHREDKKITIDGVERCKDYFSAILSAGTEVKIGQKIIQSYSTASTFQTGANVRIFCSPHEEVKYIDDEDCFQLGELFIPLPGNLIAKLLFKENPFVIEYTFGDTELKMTAFDVLSGNRTSCTLELKEED